MSEQEMIDAIVTLKAQIEALKTASEAPVSVEEKEKSMEKKNHLPIKPQAGRKYRILDNALASWGKVPQQQSDLLKIIANNFGVGEEPTEAEVFNVVTTYAAEYPSLTNSVALNWNDDESREQREPINWRGWLMALLVLLGLLLGVTVVEWLL